MTFYRPAAPLAWPDCDEQEGHNRVRPSGDALYRMEPSNRIVLIIRAGPNGLEARVQKEFTFKLVTLPNLNSKPDTKLTADSSNYIPSTVY